MPTYEYRCKECEHTFTDLLKMDERELPTKSPCPNCGAVESVENQMSAPAVIADNTRLTFYKKIPGALKEKYQEIKRKNPKSTIKF